MQLVWPPSISAFGFKVGQSILRIQRLKYSDSVVLFLHWPNHQVHTPYQVVKYCETH